MEREITLRGGRKVLVRDLRENDDVFDMARFINEFVDEGAFITIDKKLTPEEEADWLRGKMEEIKKGNTISWTVLFNGKRVGGCEARRGRDKKRNAVDVGITLSKEFRGQGLGYQLLSMLIKEIKERWAPSVIWLSRLEGNEHANALYKKLGFVECGRLPKAILHKGKQIDEIFMCLRGT